MNNDKPRISVVVVSWNTKKLVADCLDSLKGAHLSAGMEIVLVDNASTDGTVELVRRKFPDVKVIQNSENLGFARANNIGIGFTSGEYICLINSDVVVPPDCLQKMEAYLSGQPRIGMLGPKMILPDGSIGQSCMRFPTPWNWFCRALALDSLFKGSKIFGDFMMSGFAYDRTEDVEVLTGWFWMIRRRAMEEVGLLEEQFFMYGEDIDWPKRFHTHGWRVVFYPEAQAIHHCAGSSSSAPTRFYVEMYRADMDYFRKHHGPLAVAAFWMTTWIHQVVRILGYGLLYVFNRSIRASAGFKVRRSAACLMWMAGLGARKSQ
ncbi:MAG: glycosyltransferase family 2 protein [Terriglobales bacterium]